ncbi:MAG: AI-2E family transporter [Patescibacteria group bacterium]
MKNPILKYIIQNHFLGAILIIAFVWFAIEIKEILVVIFISFIIMSTLSPYVDLLRKRRFPNVLAVMIPYIVTISILVVLIVPLIPFFSVQLQTLFSTLPSYIDRAAKLLNIPIDITDANKFLTSEIDTIGKNALLVTGKLFSGIFSFLAILVISFYLMLERERIKKEFTSLFPKEIEGKVLTIISKVENKLGAWLRGQVVLSFTIGVSTWVALTIIGLPFALPLALLAGILEIVPTIGPTISAIPAIIVALTISPTLAIIVIVSYILIQMLENNLLVPKIMERAVGLNPIVIIIGVMVGAKIMGVLGALLAVPFVTMLRVLFRNLKTQNNTT